MSHLKFIGLCLNAPIIEYDASMNRHSIIHDNGISRIVNNDPLVTELIRLLTPESDHDSIYQYDLAALKKLLTYSWVIDKSDEAKLALDILSTLHALIGTRLKKYIKFDNILWEKVAGLLKGYLDKDNNFGYNPIQDINYRRATAILKLKEYGAIIKINNEEIKIENVGRIYLDIDQRIRNIGGRFFIKYFLKRLHFSTDLGRFLLPKKGNNADPFYESEPNTPFNYMLNVGLKNIEYQGELKFQNEYYIGETIELMKLVCFALYEVQSDSVWAEICHTGKTPLDYLRDLVYRESIFDLYQSSMRFVVRFIEFIARKSIEFDDELPFPANKFLKAIIYLNTFSKTDEFVPITGGKLKNRKIGERELIEILDACSLPAADFNTGFLKPTDYNNVNFWNYPIVKIGNSSWLLLPRSISARCWYEAFIAWIRIMRPSIDQEIGNMMEEFLHGEFKKTGINVANGNYVMNDKTKGECDGLIEDQSTIVLLELKKKPLVRASLKGSDSNIILDLAKSLLASQVQGLRTSLALKQGPLVLDNGKSEVQITLDGRDIERISVTLFPYGDLQDRILVDEILKILYRYRFNLDSTVDINKLEPDVRREIKQRIKDFKKLEDTQKELEYYVEELNEKRPFFNSWFLDVEKIMYLLKNVSSPDEFVSSLKENKFVSFGTFDFYLERYIRGSMKI